MRNEEIERRKETEKRNREVMDRISRERVEAGVCRHCAGPLPCYSKNFGDVRPGVRHGRRSLWIPN